MSGRVFAKRYAQSIFEIAQETEKLDYWQSVLEKSCKLCHISEFLVMMENPSIKIDDKVGLILDYLKLDDEQISNFIHLLIRRGKIKELPRIKEEYGLMVDRHNGISHVKLTTAIPLGEEDRSVIAGKLEKETGKKMIIRSEVSPDVIAGIIIHMDDMLLDGSVASRLKLLKKELSGK